MQCRKFGRKYQLQYSKFYEIRLANSVNEIRNPNACIFYFRKYCGRAKRFAGALLQLVATVLFLRHLALIGDLGIGWYLVSATTTDRNRDWIVLVKEKIISSRNI
jgi:hypothetical protein